MTKSDVKNWQEVPLILNTKQVAELTGCGQQTIRELCHARKIPFTKLGRAFIFSRDALKTWIEQLSTHHMSY